MFDIKLFIKSLDDYFTKDMLKMLIYPLIGSALVLYITFFSIASSGLEQLQHSTVEIQSSSTTLHNGVIDTQTTNQTYTGNGILDFLLQYSITSWIVSFLVYTVGLFAIGYLSIFISLIIVGFLTPKILAIIHKRHYHNLKLQKGYENIFGSIIHLLKTISITLLLLIFLIPLYFIPIINIFAINFPFYYMFHKMLNYDVSSNILSKEQFTQIYYRYKNSFRAKTALLYLLSLIPFVAFFISIFYTIYLGHSYFSILDKEQNKQ